MEETPIVNKVAQSGIVTIDLADYKPDREVLAFDLADYLFEKSILREKEFRQRLQEHDWEKYREAAVALYCSEDVIIPLWAWMLVTRYLEKEGAQPVYGNPAMAYQQAFAHSIEKKLVPHNFKGMKVVIKGCGDESIPEAAYIKATEILLPVVDSLMYGEPCSTVPVYKKPKS